MQKTVFAFLFLGAFAAAFLAPHITHAQVQDASKGGGQKNHQATLTAELSCTGSDAEVTVQPVINGLVFGTAATLSCGPGASMTMNINIGNSAKDANEFVLETPDTCSGSEGLYPLKTPVACGDATVVVK